MSGAPLWVEIEALWQKASLTPESMLLVGGAMMIGLALFIALCARSLDPNGAIRRGIGELIKTLRR